MSQKLGIVDLFCGTGGFSRGIETASESFEVVGGIDKKEEPVKTFNHNHDSEAIQSDVCDLEPHDFLSELQIEKEDINIVVGGPPCQGFSTLQAKSGHDERNNLYLEFIRYIRGLMPEVVVMENVPELAMDYSDVLDDCVDKLEDMGYVVECRILNSVFYGVPQTRKRLILIASKAGDPIYPDPTHYSDVERTRGEDEMDQYVRPDSRNDELMPARTTMDAIGDLPFLQPSCTSKQNSDCNCQGRYSDSYGTEPLNSYQEKMRSNGEKLTEHKCPNHSDRMIQMIQHVPEGKGVNSIPKSIRPSSGYTSSYGRLPGDEPSNTLTSAFTSISSNKCAHPRQNRALTIREGARIQSFPDDFKFPISSKSEKSRQIGNAVPPLLGKKIGKSIDEIFF